MERRKEGERERERERQRKGAVDWVFTRVHKFTSSLD